MPLINTVVAELRMSFKVIINGKALIIINNNEQGCKLQPRIKLSNNRTSTLG
jgi:hypothetical protein